MNVGKQDLSYRVGYSGNAIVASGGEVICNTFHRLLYMIPGEDDYEKEMGLDTEYEAMITKQLYTYTDIIPITVVAIYQNKLLIVMMDCMYDNKEYRLQASSDPNLLATKIEPKVVGAPH